MVSFSWGALLFLFVLPYDVYSFPLHARAIKGYSEENTDRHGKSTIPLQGLDWRKFGYKEDLEFSTYTVKIGDKPKAVLSWYQGTKPVLMADNLDNKPDPTGQKSKYHMSELLTEFLENGKGESSEEGKDESSGKEKGESPEKRTGDPAFLVLPNVKQEDTRKLLTRIFKDGYYTPGRPAYNQLMASVLGKMVSHVKPNEKIEYIYVADAQCASLAPVKGGPTLVFSYEKIGQRSSLREGPELDEGTTAHSRQEGFAVLPSRPKQKLPAPPRQGGDGSGSGSGAASSSKDTSEGTSKGNALKGAFRNALGKGKKKGN